MAWTTPKTWNVGDIMLASDLNTYVRDNTNFLAAPPLLRVYRNAAYTGVGGTAVTVMPFDTVQYDTSSAWNSGGHYYAVPVVGSYLTVSCLTWATGAGTTNTVITKNAVTWANGPLITQIAGMSNFSSPAVDIVVCTTVGDQITISYANSGAVGLFGGADAFASIVKVSN